MDKIRVKRNAPINPTLYMHIPDIATATACINAITRSHMLPHNTMGELAEIMAKNPKELLKLRHIGKKRLAAIVELFDRAEFIDEEKKEETAETAEETHSKITYGIRGVEVLLTDGTRLQIVATGTNVGFIKRYKGRPAGLMVKIIPRSLYIEDMCTHERTIIDRDHIVYYKEKYLPIYPSEEEYEGYLPLARALLGKEEEHGRTTDI
jgi:hypothetical protein